MNISDIHTKYPSLGKSNMNEPIEETYFKWLYSKVAFVDVPTPSLTHWTLIKGLHSTEFVWIVPNDDNRVEDGLDVRREFCMQANLDQDPFWLNVGCSVLEMLIAFARKLEFETDIELQDWFWIFMEHLGLQECDDAMPDVAQQTAEAVERLIWRTYNSDGSEGGLFPLTYPKHDQRKVEIWYQFCEWLAEHEQD